MLYIVGFSGFGSLFNLLGVFQTKALAIEAITEFVSRDKYMGALSFLENSAICFDSLTNEYEIFSIETYTLNEKIIN